MTISTWSNNVNTKFFNYQKKAKPNTIVSDFASGRVTGYLKNSRQIMQISASLLLTKEEEAYFWEWFEEIGADIGAFTCSALGSSYYRFISVPTPADTDQAYTTLQLEIEEVY